MTSLKTLRTFSIVTVAALVTAAAPAVKRVPGFTYESVTKGISENPGMPAGAGNFSMTGRTIATSTGASRMDVVSVEGASQVYAVGDYIIVKDGTMSLVHPASKTYVDLMAQATGALAAMPPQMLAQMMITDITGKSEVVGTETIEGRPTEHRRITIGYAMAMMGQSIPTTIVSDYWLAKLPAAVFNPLAPPKTEASIAMAGPMGEVVRKQIELTPKAADGMPLRFSIVTSVNMMGRSLGTTISAEVKNFKEGDVDASLIAVPADYMKVAK